MNEAGADRRRVPAVHRLLADARIAAAAGDLDRATVKTAIACELDAARAGARPTSYDAIVAAVGERLRAAHARVLQPAINATGVLLHTNLGRAPLAPEALAAIARIAGGYANLEYDLTGGRRGSRHEAIADEVRALTGAEDCVVVGNGAAALLLVLDTFAKGREAIVSRGELIEIGGGFRIPDVLDHSGAALVEVGTTNRTYLRDVERALGPRTALLLRTHRSNFAIEGYVREIVPAELAALGRRQGVAVVEDLGSGAIVDLTEYGLPAERTVGDVLGDGFDLVTFSCDKLLGGPQAGIVAGRRAAVARVRANPLLRALRVDKLTLAALAATLRLHRTHATRAHIPLYRMLGASIASLEARAAAYRAAVPSLQVVPTEARVGAGALPAAVLPSRAVRLAAARPDAVLAALRGAQPPVVARIDGDAVLLDLRTIAPGEDPAAIAALLGATPA